MVARNEKGINAFIVIPFGLLISMVGGVGFECATGAQALIGIALPAFGGPRLSLKIIEPFYSQAGF
jgi:hypothetical protein